MGYVEKQCQSCKAVKPLDEFHVRTKAPDGRQSRCKLCNSEQRKVYYKTAHGRDKNVSAGKRLLVRNQIKILTYLQSHPCVDCGEADIIVLEFDHLPNFEKKSNISEMIAQVSSLSNLKLEIAKCEIRCANCHRRMTAKRAGWRKLNLGCPLVVADDTLNIAPL